MAYIRERVSISSPPPPTMSKRPHSSPIVDENADIATALLTPDVEYNSEETMEYEAWKKMKTAADDSLNMDYMQDC